MSRDDITDLTQVRADDQLIDQLGSGDNSDEVVQMLDAWARETRR